MFKLGFNLKGLKFILEYLIVEVLEYWYECW